MSEAGVLSRIFKSASTAKLLDFFMDHDSFDYPVTEVARVTGLSTQTVYKEVLHLAGLGLLTRHRMVGKTPLYRLNAALGPIGLLSEFTLQMSQVPPLAASDEQAGGLQQIMEVEPVA